MSTRKTLIYFCFPPLLFLPPSLFDEFDDRRFDHRRSDETTVALELRTMQSLSGHFLRKIMRSRATNASRRNEPMPVAELHARCRSMDVPNYHPQHVQAERRPRQTQNVWGCWRAQSPQQRARARSSGPPRAWRLSLRTTSQLRVASTARGLSCAIFWSSFAKKTWQSRRNHQCEGLANSRIGGFAF